MKKEQTTFYANKGVFFFSFTSSLPVKGTVFLKFPSVDLCSDSKGARREGGGKVMPQD